MIRLSRRHQDFMKQWKFLQIICCTKGIIKVGVGCGMLSDGSYPLPLDGGEREKSSEKKGSRSHRLDATRPARVKFGPGGFNLNL
ncbi:hypothetical protein SLEP1_g56039 [Rubroshorea leprosula]|uniref:Uncharacterized protein n=1 Tax=Rubroshorea leprosula TaxID=152421 RepID=A0AAV5MH69_9ROSI|nr:hypothetical protein SLEP1_g56039 [Rubroshorea leprosula]